MNATQQGADTMNPTKQMMDQISKMNRAELARLEQKLGMSKPDETYLETALRLCAKGDHHGSCIYRLLEDRWFETE
jgi:hypothetical protein